MWTHPVTIVLLGSLIAGIAYIIKMVLENNKIVFNISEIIKELQQEQREMRKEFDELRGEHTMMKSAGNMIANHSFEPEKKNYQQSSKRLK
jgi:uncharacterized membrane protein (DUF106 family)